MTTTAPARTGFSAFTLTGVRRTFGAVTAVDGIDLSVAPGEVVAFLGPNGAGKTTTIDMILGLGEPDSGTVSVLGMTPRQAIDRGLISAVMQTGGLLPDLTVKETVTYMAAVFGNALEVDDAMARAGLTELADRKVAKCSGGEQQRIRFALALLPDPELLILDEPTTGMDVEVRRAFWASIRHEAARGRTILFATHYLEEADAYADRIVLVSHGRIVADGTGAEIKARVSGRTLRCTWPGANPDDVRALDGVQDVEVRGESLLVHCDDSDSLARFLLTHTPAKDLEIAAKGLEEAFIALTTEGNLR